MTKRPGSKPSPAKPRADAGRHPSAPDSARWPTLAEMLDPRMPWLGPAVALVISRVALSFQIPLAAEDAYITFRYARSLAHGLGLVFNPGERVFGFSSPLWTLWCALGEKLGVPIVLWARSGAMVAELVTLWVLVTLLLRHASKAAAWCFAFFYVAWPYFGAVGVSGMENPVMVGLIALAALGSARRSTWAGPALAAVALTRPEGIAAAAVVALWASWRDRLIGAALTLAGLVALWLYFGTWVPQSVIAKSAVYGTPGPWAGRFWWDWLSPFVLGQFTNSTETAHLFLLSLVFGPAAWFGARAVWGARGTPLAAFIAACLAVWLGYAVLGVAYFWWYLAVPLAGWLALASVGFPRLARGPALYVTAALLVVGLWTVAFQLYVGRAQNEYLGFGRVAEFLLGHARPGEKAMLEPIGMVGYWVPLVIVDEVGLVSPSVAKRRLEGAGWYADVAARERPDWLVLRRSVLTSGRAFAGAGAPFRSVAERDSLFARYQVAASIDTTSGDNMLVVLRRWR